MKLGESILLQEIEPGIYKEIETSKDYFKLLKQANDEEFKTKPEYIVEIKFYQPKSKNNAI